VKMTRSAPRKTAAERAAELLKRAEKDPSLACLLRVLHERFALWRLCRNKACKRARCCRGDEVACGARRWPSAKSMLGAIRRARLRQLRCGTAASRHFQRLAAQALRGPGPVLVSWKSEPPPS